MTERPPQSGLPIWEHWWLTAVLKPACAFTSDARAVRLLQTTGRELLTIADHAGAEDAFEPVQVPRLLGIEHSSRHWSVMMVIEHLSLVNTDILKIIRSLQKDVAPRGKVEIADYKPEQNIGWDAADRFRAGLTEFEIVGATPASMASYATFAHPWFGLLNAHQWLCLAAFHHRIHLRQTRRIVAILGVT